MIFRYRNVPTVVENVEEMGLKIEQTPGSIGYLEE
jgi:hypothetical protein